MEQQQLVLSDNASARDDVEFSARGIVRRKPRAGKLMKWYRRTKGMVFSYGPTMVRYGLVPGMLLVSLYWTEPQPSLWELLNPFTR